MKKLLALLLAALFVFSTATMFVSAASPKPIERDEKNIIKMDFLDFNAESNALWAKEKDDGSGYWENTIGYGEWEYPQDEEGTQIAPYLRENYSTFKNYREFSFIENGEVLHFEVTGSTTTPGLYFILDEAHNEDVPIGSESADNAKAEYIKIRVRNYSTANRFTIAFTANQTNQYRFMPATLSDLIVDANGKEYKSATGEWETYIINMPTANINTNYEELLPVDSVTGAVNSRWGGLLEALILIPFGYDVTDGTGAYPGAEIDIDYVVMGSLDYVTNYKSELELKEESITKLELVKEPTKKNYYVGESLELDGLELKATYNDGTTEILTSTSYKANLETGSTNTPVTLTFGSQKAQYNINVVGVESIEVVGTPENTTYEAADISGGFSPEGFTFKVNYTDGTSRTDFPAAAFRCSAENLGTAGTKNVTANFYGIKTNFDINVINVTDVEITAPTKTYRYGDTVTEDDISVTFVYNDGTKISSDDAVIDLEYTITADTTGATGEVMATLNAVNTTYGVNITKEFPIKIDTPVALKVATEPLKTTYQPSEPFDKTGLSVALVYEDGKTALLGDDQYTARADTSTPGDVRVSIKCNVAGLEDLKLEENYTIKVEGEVANTDNSSTNNTSRRPQGGDESEGISPVIIVVIIIAVVVVAGVVVVLVVLKKKKK